jgi:hypothetical protein
LQGCNFSIFAGAPRFVNAQWGRRRDVHSFVHAFPQ